MGDGEHAVYELLADQEPIGVDRVHHARHGISMAYSWRSIVYLTGACSMSTLK